MSRVYISGPISNTTDFQERFAKAQEKLEKQGYSVINPALVLSNMPKDTTWEEYMELSMVMLEMADSIYMLKGHEKSKGAQKEYFCARMAGMEIMFEETDEQTPKSGNVLGKMLSAKLKTYPSYGKSLRARRTRNDY